jgi:hypothetical protein
MLKKSSKNSPEGCAWIFTGTNFLKDVYLREDEISRGHPIVVGDAFKAGSFIRSGKIGEYSQYLKPSQCERILNCLRGNGVEEVSINRALRMV